MYAIVHSLVLLRDTHNILFFVSLAFIPLSFVYAGLGYYAVSIRLIVILCVLYKNAFICHVRVPYFAMCWVSLMHTQYHMFYYIRTGLFKA